MKRSKSAVDAEDSGWLRKKRIINKRKNFITVV
jgi:hypothetical protein